MPILLAALVTSVTEATTAVVDSSIHLSIDVANPDHEIGPLLHGLFLEDINFSGDGGIYAELVRNRSFEDREPLFAWTRIGAERAGRVEVASEKPVHPNNPTYLQITAVEDGSPLGVVNAGFDGIPVEEGKRYRFSVRAQTIEGRSSSLLARLESAGGVTLGEVAIERISGPWREYEGWITSAGTTTKAKLFVLAESTGSVDLDFVSLFPEDTWKKRRNGLRADLVQILADMRPGFIRFPGGCIVEGVDFQDMYRWKDTIGGIAERKENWNLWQTPNGPAGH
ncbi:MAG: carbohydrate binding domain-containing protein, partial [Opitutaceae bacterium]